MDEDKVIVENTEEIADKKDFIVWIKEHKSQLILAGISVTVVLATALGIRNKEAITKLWNTIKKE